MIRVSFPLPPYPFLSLFRRLVYTRCENFRLYIPNLSRFSLWRKDQRKQNHSLPSPILLHRSFSFPLPKLKKKKEHNPPRYCTSEPRRVSMLCLPIAATKDKLDCNKNLLTLYTLLYIDCTRISNITHSKYSTSVHVLYIHQTLTIARHWTYTKTNTRQPGTASR